MTHNFVKRPEDNMTNEHLPKQVIHYQAVLSPDNFLQAQTLHLGWGRFHLLIIPIIMSYVHPGAPLSIRLVGFGFGCLLVAICLWWQRQQTLTLYRQSPYLHEPWQGTISVQGLGVENQTGYVELAWHSFIKQKQNDKLILLYRSPCAFHILTKAFFAKNSEWEEVKRMVEQRVSLIGSA